MKLTGSRIRNWLRNLIRYAIKLLLILCLIIILIPLILALPPVKKRIIRKANHKVSEVMQGDFRLENFTYVLPVGLSLQQISFHDEFSDIQIDGLKVKLQKFSRRGLKISSNVSIDSGDIFLSANTIAKLASKEKKDSTDRDPKNWVIGADLKLKKTFFTWSNIDTIQVFSGGAQSIKISNARIGILQRKIEWGKVDINGACASVIAGGSRKPRDKKNKESWLIQGKTVALSDSYFDLNILPDKLFLSSDINSILVKSSAIDLTDKSIRVSGLGIDGLRHVNLIKPDTLQKSDKKDKERKPFDWDIQLKSGDLNNVNFAHSMVGENHLDTVFSPAYMFLTDFTTQIKEARISKDKVVFSAKDFSLGFNNRINLQNAKLEFASGENSLTARVNTLLNDANINCNLELGEDHRKLLLTHQVPNGKVSFGAENFKPSVISYFTMSDSLLSKLNDPVSITVEANVENDWAEIVACNVRVESLGEIKIQGAIDQINTPDSLMFQLTNSMSLRPSYFKTFLSDSSGITRFLPEEIFTIEGNIVGNKISAHTKQLVLSDYIDVPIEASYFRSDSSFQFSLNEMKIWGDSLFAIPLKVISGDLHAEGNFKDGPQINAEGELNQIIILEQPYSNFHFNTSFNQKSLLGNLSISDSLLQSNLDIYLNIDSGINAFVNGEIMLTADSVLNNIDNVSLASALNISYSKSKDSSISAAVIFTQISPTINNTDYKIDTVSLTLNEKNNSTGITLNSDILNSDFIFDNSLDSLLGWLGNGMGYKTKHDTATLIDYFSVLPGLQLQAKLNMHPLLEKLLLQEKIEFKDLDVHIVSVQDGEMRGSVKINNPKNNNLEVGKIEITADLISEKVNFDAQINGLVRENMDSEHFHITGDLVEGHIQSQIKGYDNSNEIKFLTSLEFKKDSALNSFRIPIDTLIFLGKPWSINPDNRFVFSAETIYDGQLELSQGDKKVSIRSIASCPIQIAFENIELEPIVAIVNTSSNISGKLNSTVCFPNNNFSDIRTSLELLNLVVDGEEIGDYILNNSISFSDTSNILLAGNIFHNTIEKMDFSGTINKDSWKNSVFKLHLSELTLRPMGILIQNYVNELEGSLTGNISFDGSSKALWEGNLEFNNMMINPKMVNNRLRFTDNRLKFENRSIVFNNIPIIDEQGKQMLIDGKLYFQEFNKPTMQLTVRTDSMQILNIPDMKTNPIFGRVIASNRLNISGPLKSPTINLNLSLIKGTDFTFRIMENLNSYEGEGIVNFVGMNDSEKDNEEQSFSFYNEERGVDMNAKVIINPDTRLRLNYSENMEFDIALSGNGNIAYKSSRSGRENMTGTYTVEDGEAILKLQGLAPKNFTISPQSYMRWDGAMDNPIVDIQAIYSVKGSYENPASGMSNTIIVDYDVRFVFKNRLNNPEIVFDLETQDQYMTTVLNAMTKEERVKQAINVLLLGYIVTPETKGSASKIITDHINQFWAQQLNSAADKSFGGVEVSVDIQNITNYSAGNAQDQTNLSYEVKKDIWNDRATVKVGGYVRTYTSSPQDASSRLIGDFSLEYKLNQKENLYGKLFSENKYEGILEGEIQRTGVGVLYRQNYHSMSEIWERRRQKKADKKKKKQKGE